MSVDSTAKDITNPREQEESDHSTKFALTKDAIKAISNDVDIRSRGYASFSGVGTLIQAMDPSDYEDSDDIYENELYDNTLLLRNSQMQARMEDGQLTIGGKTYMNDTEFVDKTNAKYIRTLFDNGTVDVANANLNVYTDDDTNKKTSVQRTY